MNNNPAPVTNQPMPPQQPNPPLVARQSPLSGPPPPPQNPPAEPVQKTVHESRLSPYLLALAVFIIGLALGALLFAYYPKLMNKNEAPASLDNGITLPKDAAKVQDCVDNKGQLFAKPGDIPLGPVYMVYENKVIGLEYELNRDELLKGKVYDGLAALNIHVDHINTALLRSGEAGLPGSHAYIDFYLVDVKTEQKIKCPAPVEPVVTLEASPSADLNLDLNSSSSAEATPSATATSIPTATILPTVLPTATPLPTGTPIP